VRHSGAPDLPVYTYLPFVILRACDFIRSFVFFATPADGSQPPQQNRHPERSASQIYRIPEGLWRAAEGPRRCLLADALASFPATNYKEIKKVTSSERSASQSYRKQRLYGAES
jgi:hypothetical protein